MLKNHCSQLGIKLTSNPPWLFTAPTVNRSVDGPAFESPFDLPANSFQYQRFIETQTFGWRMGHPELKVSKRHVALGRGFARTPGVLLKVSAAFVGDL